VAKRIASPLPVPELAASGEMLQQAIVLTRMRVEGLPDCRIKARGRRIVEQSNKLFMHVSAVAQTTAGLTGFLGRAMGVTIDDLFEYTGKAQFARGITYAGIEAVNGAVRRAIDDLNAVNVAIDKEVAKNGKKDKPD
jgi:hypothetical protein